MRVLSLGWGTQSSALAVMAALGDIEPVDFAMHADTTHERTATYEYAKLMTPWLEDRGINVITVQDIRAPKAVYQPDDMKGQTHIPLFTFNGIKNGQLRRSCTPRWKIVPMRRFVSKCLEVKGVKKTPGVVKKLLGISMDEYQRMSNGNDVKYEALEYPLIDKRMSRHDCIQYLENAGVPVPPRSACVFCPYQSKKEWRWLRDNAPQDWQKAVEIDALLRKARPPYDLYVCDQRKPLPECDFSTPQDRGQLEFDFCDSGYCFV